MWPQNRSQSLDLSFVMPELSKKRLLKELGFVLRFSPAIKTKMGSLKSVVAQNLMSCAALSSDKINIFNDIYVPK